MKFFKRNKKREKILSDPMMEDLDYKDFVLPLKLQYKVDRVYSSNNTYYTFATIKSFSSATENQALLTQLSLIKGVHLMFDVAPLNFSKFKEALDTTIVNERDLIKTETDAAIAGNRKNFKTTLISEIDQTNDITLSASILIKMIGKSIEELNSIKDAVYQRVNGISANEDALFELQKKAFWSFLPFNVNEIRKYIIFPFTTKTLSNLFLPSFDSFVQEKGTPFAKSVSGGDIMVDHYTRSLGITNSNFVVFGKSGMGKSYAMKKIILKAILDGLNVIVLDPQDEYISLFEYFNGNIMDLPKVNPLQIRIQSREYIEGLGVDEAYQQGASNIVGTSYLLHLNYLRKWFVSYTQQKGDCEKCFEALCREVYGDFRIGIETPIELIQNHQWPLLQDVYNKAVLKASKEEDGIWSSHDYSSVAKALSTAVGEGSDSYLFNQHTEIPFDLSKQVLICVRLTNVIDLETRTKDAAYLNMNNYFGSLIFRDKTKPFMYAIDEAHLAIDKDSKAENYAIKEIATMYKIARKFEGGIGFATTNISDLDISSIADYVRPIIDQSSFKYLFKVKDGDLQILKKMITGLNEKEIDIIEKNAKSQCLFIAGDQRYHINIQGVDLNQPLTGTEDPYLLKEAQIFGLEGGR